MNEIEEMNKCLNIKTVAQSAAKWSSSEIFQYEICVCVHVCIGGVLYTTQTLERHFCISKILLTMCQTWKMFSKVISSRCNNYLQEK